MEIQCGVSVEGRDEGLQCLTVCEKHITHAFSPPSTHTQVMHAADEPIHIVNVGLRSEASEHQSDTALAQKCYTFVQNKVSTAALPLS